MTQIDPSLIKNLITQSPSGMFFVPDSITNAIGKHALSDIEAIEAEYTRLRDLYDSFQRKNEPTIIEYSGTVTIDTYSVKYLPRNTLVPKLAFLYCAYHPLMQNLPERLKILDIGSGTGGVLLGLLDLFHNAQLSGTCLDIVALDGSQESLDRQRELVNDIGLKGSSHVSHLVDLADPSSYIEYLEAYSPYDMIFAANIFTELNEDAIDNIINHSAKNLAEDGIIINAEAHGEYIRNQKVRIIKNARNLGLNVYYPCPPLDSNVCPKESEGCWTWRHDEFKCPYIAVRGSLIDTVYVQIAHLTILTSMQCSIYEIAQRIGQSKIWGIAAPRIKNATMANEMMQQRYEFCTKNGLIDMYINETVAKYIERPYTQPEIIKRGAIVGIPSDNSEISYNRDFCGVGI